MGALGPEVGGGCTDVVMEGAGMAGCKISSLGVCYSTLDGEGV